MDPRGLRARLTGAGCTSCGAAGCRNANLVPLFPAVYHGRAVVFGNYAHIDGITPYDELWPQEASQCARGEKCAGLRRKVDARSIPSVWILRRELLIFQSGKQPVRRGRCHLEFCRSLSDAERSPFPQQQDKPECAIN